MQKMAQLILASSQRSAAGFGIKPTGDLSLFGEKRFDSVLRIFPNAAVE